MVVVVEDVEAVVVVVGDKEQELLVVVRDFSVKRVSQKIKTSVVSNIFSPDRGNVDRNGGKFAINLIHTFPNQK